MAVRRPRTPPPPETFRCPKCARTVRASGQAWVDGAEMPCSVFQCPKCLVDFEMDGETFKAAYTFVAGSDGLARDPTDGTTFAEKTAKSNPSE